MNKTLYPLASSIGDKSSLCKFSINPSSKAFLSSASKIIEGILSNFIICAALNLLSPAINS